MPHATIQDAGLAATAQINRASDTTIVPCWGLESTSTESETEGDLIHLPYITGGTDESILEGIPDNRTLVAAEDIQPGGKYRCE